MTPDETLLPSMIPEVPKCLQIRSVTKGLISFTESQTLHQYRKAAHALDDYGKMHVRFDGTFGFAGGIIDEGEDLLDGLHRELEEEIAWDSEKHRITMSDYFNTQIDNGKNLILHFFTKQIPYEDLVELEKRCLTSKEFGIEVLGTVRVPLYTMNNEYGGLPAFLNNKFVGTAKQQLLLSLHHTRILNEAEIEETMYKSQNMKLAPSRF